MFQAGFEPGTVIGGKYVVERWLGSGGMGVVLAVRHAELGELYALKLMLPAAAASPAARERFAREAKAAAKLKSAHVARAIDFGFVRDDGPPFMVLELLSGQNLAEKLLAEGPMPAFEIAGLMLDACDALREAHAEGIVHRDLKPSNLFVVEQKDGTPSLKVLDFGIAKTVAQDAGALTKTSTTMGSPFYMSPEQMRSAKSADARSDIWSLGVTMYELATGTVPFTGESVTEVAIMVIEAAVPSPRVHRADLEDDFVNIIMKCLQKNPEHRFTDVEELAESLAAFVGRPWRRQRPKPAPANRSLDALHSLATAPTELPSERTVPASPLAESKLVANAPPPVDARTSPGAVRQRSLWLRAAGAVLLLGAALGLAYRFRGATPEVSDSAVASDTVADAPPLARSNSAELATPSASAARPEPDLGSAIRDAFASRKAELQGCYDAGLRTNPTMAADVKFRLNVLPDGTPKNFEILGEGLDEAVKRCLIGSIATLVFPSSSTRKELQIVHAYTFSTRAPKPQAALKARPTKGDFTPNAFPNSMKPPVQNTSVRVTPTNNGNSAYGASAGQ